MEVENYGHAINSKNCELATGYRAVLRKITVKYYVNVIKTKTTLEQ